MRSRLLALVSLLALTLAPVPFTCVACDYGWLWPCRACEPPAASLMSAIYEAHKAKDGFLYITYSGENTFG